MTEDLNKEDQFYLVLELLEETKYLTEWEERFLQDRLNRDGTTPAQYDKLMEIKHEVSVRKSQCLEAK